MTARRNGYALVEILVVMTVVAVMLTLCAGMIHLLLKLDRSGRTASEVANDLTRLARDFRTDAHAANPIPTPSGASDRLTLSIEAGRSVEYLVRPLDVLRTVREGDKVRLFETYRRPSRASIAIEVRVEEPRPIARIVIDRPSDGQDNALYHDFRIDAELGKDQRLNPRVE